MTKDQFRRLALAGIDQVLSMPDDLWEMTRPIVALTVGSESVVIGIKLREDDEDQE